MRIATGMLALGAYLAVLAPGLAHARADLTALVNPFVGTASGAADFGTGGGAGNTFPGATVPFGMAQPSPDTLPGIDAFGGGYSHRDDRIGGFGLKHISGPGCAAYGDVPFLPTTKPIDRSPAKPLSIELDGAFVPRFRHEDEHASPGFYRVKLDRELLTQITATRRTGAFRFTFPKAAKERSVLVNAAGTAMGAKQASVTIDPSRRELSGEITTGSFCYQRNRYTLRWVARFDQPFAAHGTWERQTLKKNASRARDALAGDPLVKKPAPGLPNDGHNGGSTAQAGAYVSFDAGTRTVEARVGLSFVDATGARANLDRESDGRSFGTLRRAAGRAWNRALSRARVSGGRRADRRVYYTALYHALLHPSTFSDADGRYRGFDGRVHRAHGWTKYADISGWDTYRSQMPLLALLEPKRASDIVRSLVADAEQSGYLPKWGLANGHTNVMVGDPADLLIAGAHAFGARDFDTAAALRAMRKGATEPGRSENGGYVPRPGLAEYLRTGYVPYEQNTDVLGQTFAPDLAWGSAATSLEYALADFGIAQLAKARCDRGTYATFMRRSASWRASFDPGRKLIAPRSLTGLRLPTEPGRTDGFVEGNAEQYTWFVPHDVAGLVGALGGEDAALARLERFFADINAGPGRPHAFLGNEPTLLTPFVFTWLGRPDRTQAVVRRALLELYGDSPGGFPGNDDLGAMSAWWVLGALGLNPAVPGTDVLVLGSPLFPRADVRLRGRALTILAPRARRDRPYVKGVRRGRRALDRAWLRASELPRTLRFDLRASPQPWGRDARPPSFPPDANMGC